MFLPRVAIAAALLFAAHIPAAATDPAPQPGPSPPRFASRTDLVTVDVTVYDDQGRPVETLGPDDFTVLVDGTPRRVTTLGLFGPGEATASRQGGAAVDRSPVDTARDAAAAADDPFSPAPPRQPGRLGRRFVIVIDREHIRAGEGQQALEGAARLVRGLPESDRVTVWTLPGRSGKLSFDESRATLARRIREALGVYRPMGDPTSDAFWTANLVDRRQRALATLGNLRDLLRALAPLEGPKHVVLVTGGALLDTGTLGLLREVAVLATSSRTQIHTLHTRPLSGPAARADIPQMATECRDEGILSKGAAGYELALLTGGFADTPSEGLIEGAAFDRLARQLSAWYLLAFEPIEADRDERTHRIEVRLANRADVTVRARRTFFIDAARGTAVAPATAAAAPRGATSPQRPAPPATLKWNRDAMRRAEQGLLPFVWLADWFPAAHRFRASPEPNADVETLCTWGPSRLDPLEAWLDWVLAREQEGRALPVGFVPTIMRAAALMHTGAAICQAANGGLQPGVSGHLRIARLLLTRFHDAPADGEPILLLWYRATARWLELQKGFAHAVWLMNVARGDFPADPGLHFTRGTLQETIASPLLEPYDYTTFERALRDRQVRMALDEAARDFETALRLSPTFVQARLHLGRVEYLRGHGDEARAALQAVLAARPDPDTAWLAHLLLGRLHERTGRTQDALDEYKQAVALRPSQSALVALANAFERTGDRAAARRELDRLTRLDDPGTGCPQECAAGPDDPGAQDSWLRYNLVDLDELKALLGELARRAVS